MSVDAPSAPRVVRSHVEPRLVERRRRVLEARRRRRQVGIAIAAAFAVLVAAAVGSLWSPLADVDRIDVVGAETVPRDQVLDALGIGTGDQLVSVDLAAARAGVRQLPMVAGATVTRQWPDGVRVVIAEEVPLARLVVGQAEVTVSDTGRVLPVEGEGLAVLELDGVGALAEGERVPESVRAALVVVDRMPPPLIAELDRARLGSTGSLELVLHDGTTVRFGPVEDVPAKLAAIGAALGQVVRECMDVLDVRDPSRPTVSRIDGCATPAPTEVAEEPVEATADTTADGVDGSAEPTSGAAPPTSIEAPVRGDTAQ